jgi:hypothetical protein
MVSDSKKWSLPYFGTPKYGHDHISGPGNVVMTIFMGRVWSWPYVRSHIMWFGTPPKYGTQSVADDATKPRNNKI